MANGWWSSCVVVTLCLLGGVPAMARAEQVLATVDYDTFMKQDVDSRLGTFNRIPPENQAELVRTQIERWLAKNRSRLSEEQLAVMQDNLAFVTADLYRSPRNAAIVARTKELQARTAALFSREDIGQAFTIHGSYIPAKD